MHGLIIIKSLLARVFLIAHGLICAWRVVDTNDNQYCWVILAGLGFLLIETGIVIWVRKGREFKTVAFCIIFYLTCTTPSLWIIHVETANRKLYRLAENKLNVRTVVTSSNNSLSSHDSVRFPLLFPTTTPLMLSIRHIDCHDKAWFYIEEQHWLDAIQETLFIILSISRLFISLNYTTIEQSGMIFILTLINSADLLSLSHSLQYHDVIIERFWMYIGLVLLTIGLFQMACIDINELTVIISNENSLKTQRQSFRYQNLCPLFRSLFIHDGLLFIYRTLLTAKIRCSKPSIIFFMSKNILMIIFHCYYIYYKLKKKEKKKTLVTNYEHLLDISPSLSSRNSPYPLFEYDQIRQSKLVERLLHRTLRRSLSIIHRRLPKIPPTLFSSTPPSISYPFARRRNDGGRARTAFALYGLPFRTPQIHAPTTISSCSSLVAKAFVH